MTVQINGVNVDDTCTLHYAPNPKRPNSKAHARYQNYQECTTLTEYVETADSKYAMADLRYDETMGLLTIKNANGETISLAAEKVKRTAEAKLNAGKEKVAKTAKTAEAKEKVVKTA